MTRNYNSVAKLKVWKWKKLVHCCPIKKNDRIFEIEFLKFQNMEQRCQTKIWKIDSEIVETFQNVFSINWINELIELRRGISIQDRWRTWSNPSGVRPSTWDDKSRRNSVINRSSCGSVSSKCFLYLRMSSKPSDGTRGGSVSSAFTFKTSNR